MAQFQMKKITMMEQQDQNMLPICMFEILLFILKLVV